jgi:organic radical activating enzyme
MKIDVLKSYSTTGLCSTCYRELPARIEYRSNGAAYITKVCPTHGYEEAMIERSWEFWDQAPQLNPNNRTWKIYNEVSVIEVTDRCNVQCKHCYHQPDNKIPDQDVDFIINKAIRQPSDLICLMGAEPTMRDDLNQIIKGIKDNGKKVAIYSNGLRFHDTNYLNKICDAGLDEINISIHNPKYHKDALWRKISTGIDNVVERNIKLGQLSFTVENKDEVEYAVEKILWLKSRNRVPSDFCVRSPANIGTEVKPEEEIFASEIANWLTECTADRQVNFIKHPNNGSNPYHVSYYIDNMVMQVIHWAGAKSIDTRWMNMGPYAEFVPNTRGTFMLQTILRDGWKKGWWQGQRLYNENMSNM